MGLQKLQHLFVILIAADEGRPIAHQKIDILYGYIIMLGEIVLVDLLSDVIYAPVLSIEVYHTGLISLHR